MTTRIVFANNKGGTGKTTLVVQTAGALARAGKRVLVVDMDPQANATRRLGITWTPKDPIPSVSEAIAAETPGAGAGAVAVCGWEQPEAALIDVMPARFDLLNREREAGPPSALHRLRLALEGWTDRYDFVLIDTRPDLGHLVSMTLVAADTVVLVSDCGYDSVEAAIRVEDFIGANRTYLYNPTLEVAGVVVNRFRDTAEARFQVEGILERFGDRVWNTHTTRTIPGDVVIDVTPAYVPEWTRFAEADAASCSLSAWGDARGRTTTALFDQLASRIQALAAPALAA